MQHSLFIMKYTEMLKAKFLEKNEQKMAKIVEIEINKR